jgi:hypothetical protein
MSAHRRNYSFEAEKVSNRRGFLTAFCLLQRARVDRQFHSNTTYAMSYQWSRKRMFRYAYVRRLCIRPYVRPAFAGASYIQSTEML